MPCSVPARAASGVPDHEFGQPISSIGLPNSAILGLRGHRHEGLPAKFARRHRRGGLEGAVEWTDRLEAGVDRDRQDRHVALAWIRQCRLGVVEPVAIQKRAEVAMAEPLIDRMR